MPKPSSFSRQRVIESPRHFEHEVALGLPHAAAVIEHAIHGRGAHARFAGDVDDFETSARAIDRLSVRHSHIPMAPSDIWKTSFCGGLPAAFSALIPSIARPSGIPGLY